MRDYGSDNGSRSRRGRRGSFRGKGGEGGLALGEGLDGVRGDVAGEIGIVLAGGQLGRDHLKALHKPRMGGVGDFGDEPFLLQPLI